MTRKRSPEALALLYLRHAFHWTTKRLATALGFKDEKGLTRYETGERPLSREYLETLVAPLGAPPEAIDVLLWVHDRIVSKPTEAASPIDLTARERWRIFRVALTVAWAVTERLVTELTRQRRAQKVARVRREAQELTARLKSAVPEKRRGLIDLFPEFRSWAVAEALCHDSERATTHSLKEAKELAVLGVYVAERLPEEAERARTTGYCWCYVGNARRVATEFDEADEATKRSWDLWRAGEPARWLPLAEWRLLDREASLHREQQRFTKALECIERALALCDGPADAAGRILLNKERILRLMGDLPQALAVLEQAAPLLEGTLEPRLRAVLLFNTADTLCALGRYARAEALLPDVRELVIEQGRKLDLARLLWLNAKIAAGNGRMEEAEAGLKQVRQEFTDLDLPYEVALSSLDLAVLYLEAGRTAEVRDLAVAMSQIFEAKGIAREALAALALFCEAVRKETATVELVRQVIQDVERAQHSAPPPAGRRGRGRAPS